MRGPEDEAQKSMLPQVLRAILIQAKFEVASLSHCGCVFCYFQLEGFLINESNGVKSR